MTMTTTEQIPKCVWNGKRWYTSHRLNDMRCVCVQWNNNEVTTEPVCNLVDFEEEIVNEKMLPILLNWKISVEQNMCYTSLCAFCDRNREVSSFLCTQCYIDTTWLNQMIENERIIRENRYISEIEFKNTKETLFKCNKEKSLEPNTSNMSDLNKILAKEKICQIQANLQALDLLLN